MVSSHRIPIFPALTTPGGCLGPRRHEGRWGLEGTQGGTRRVSDLVHYREIYVCAMSVSGPPDI